MGRILAKGVFEDTCQCMKSATLLCQVSNKIQADIDFSDASQRRWCGDIYEQVLLGLRRAGREVSGKEIALIQVPPTYS